MKKKYLEKFYRESQINENCNKKPIILPFALIYKIMSFELEQHIKTKYNLLASQVDVLGALYAGGGTLSPTELYDATVFSSGGMTKILKKIEALNFVKRDAISSDKRSKLVTLTPSGKEIIEEILNDATIKKENIFNVLGEDEKEQLSILLKKIALSIVK